MQVSERGSQRKFHEMRRKAAYVFPERNFKGKGECVSAAQSSNGDTGRFMCKWVGKAFSSPAGKNSNWLSECDAHLKLTAQAELFMSRRPTPSSDKKVSSACASRSISQWRNIIWPCVCAELLSYVYANSRRVRARRTTPLKYLSRKTVASWWSHFQSHLIFFNPTHNGVKEALTLCHFWNLGSIGIYNQRLLHFFSLAFFC